MSRETGGELAQDVITAARSQIGKPFLHHYYPKDLCYGGNRTLDGCMEKGLSESFDCSGLVISSYCQVLELEPKEAWPRHFRHAAQLDMLADAHQPKPGDTLVIYPDPEHDPTGWLHVGIYVAKKHIVHATQADGVVENSLKNLSRDVLVIPKQTMLALLQRVI